MKVNGVHLPDNKLLMVSMAGPVLPLTMTMTFGEGAICTGLYLAQNAALRFSIADVDI